MTDSELDKLLKSAPAPTAAPELYDELPRRVRAKLSWKPNQTARIVTHRWQIGLSLGFSLAAICLLLGFWFGNRHGQEQANGLLTNAKFVREMLATFPNQVQAIVQDENGVRLSIAKAPDVPQSQPLWIKICDGKHCRSILTFSGQTVQIDGQKVEALADASGGVMLLGDHFFWSGEENSKADHLSIQAQQLSQIL